MTRSELEKKLNYYKDIESELKNENDAAVEGKLRVSMDGKNIRYYHCLKNGEKKEVYIHANEVEIARKLAQEDYNNRINRLVRKRIGQLSRLLVDYDENEIDALFDGLHPARKKLVNPVRKTTEQNCTDWLSKTYTGKGFEEGMPVIFTNNGIRVRSKSEKIIADYFESAGIAYKYECPLILNPFGTIYPDFTVLSKKTGKEIYWEHEGLMDNPEYAKSAVKKIELYEKNGIFPGENLILTFETSVNILNMEIVKNFAESMLL